MDIEKIIEIAHQSQFEPVYPDPRFPPSLYYRFLKLLAAYMRPNVAVELGVCGGGGSLHLALGNPDGITIGVDFAWDHAENIQHIQDVCPHFHFWHGDSIAAARPIYDQYGGIGLLFLDTDHAAGSTQRELDAWRPYLLPGAVVCFDDLFRPGVDEVWDKIKEPKVRLDPLHQGGSPTDGGFGAVVMPQVPVSPEEYELGN